MRVLITGGLGFVGSNLADRLLREGHDVVLFDNLSRAGVQNNLDWLRRRHARLTFLTGDVRDASAVGQAVHGVDCVFHLAAQVAVTSSVANPREDFEINALGTLNVLEAARQQKHWPIVLYTSTNKVYGALESARVVEGETRYAAPDFPEGVPETWPLDFHSPYGCSKGAADQYVRDYYRIYGLPTIVFRMSCIYGPRQFGNEDQGWLAHFVLAALRGAPLAIYGDGKQVRDVLYVDDLTEAMLRAVAAIRTTAGRVYNIGGGPANSLSVWHEFRRYLEDALGQLPEVTFHDWRPGDQRVYISDVRRAYREFGWQPRVSPTEGIRRLLAWGQEAVRLLSSAS
ncbi:MAG: GDP-mannose 4,6-dehydratase [Acidobacteriia bacterium]|nr:GDP-mannose 4,6-dehydratase [Terriglobia bacterium]